MALSPSIPTSFVPKQPVATDKRHFSTGGNNILLFIACIILTIALVAAAGVFFYNKYLISEETAKAAEILTAQKNVSEDTVNQFIRLHDRLLSAKGILAQHVALSQFFTLLSSIDVQTVHFDGIQILVADDRSAQIMMTGEAKDFNSLATESNLFANQKYIKSAIFSNISVNKDNSVGFTLNANLDPSIVIQNPTRVTSVAPPVIVSTTTPAVIAASTTPSLPPATPPITPNVPTVSTATSSKTP